MLPLTSVLAQTADESQLKHPDEPMEFDIPRLPAEEAADVFSRATGFELAMERCLRVPVGPLKGRYTPTQAWRELLSPLCMDAFVQSGSGVGTLQSLGEREIEFRIDKAMRKEAFHQVGQQAGIAVGYLENTEQEAEEIVGPIDAKTVNEALRRIIEPADLLSRWVSRDYVAVEPSDIARKSALVQVTDACPCSPNLLVPPLSEHVTVIGSPLPMLGEYVSAPVMVVDRSRIDETGAATLPDLLRYFSQNAFMRPEGFSSTGAQYAELRGLGPETVLILINGRRAYASSNDLNVNAFDLNTIPLSAVDRVEISFDSASIKYGTDAIGGIVNIVLKQHIDKPSVEVRYASASGGGEQRRATLSAGTTGSALVLDYMELGGLLGGERDRWLNQDWRRFGGRDNRSRYGAPANLSSLDGSALPGLDSSFAAIRPSVDASILEVQPGTINLTSPSAYRTLVPEARRLSASATGEVAVAETLLSAELLAVHRTSSFFSTPNAVSGILGAAHPQNPFHEPVRVDALLTGIPRPQLDVGSNLLRGVIALSGQLRQWDWAVSLVSSDERTKALLKNLTDPIAVAAGLMNSSETPFNILALTPGEGFVPEDILAAARIDRYSSAATQFSSGMSGAVVDLPGGDLTAEVGVEWRRESAKFEAGLVDREVTSLFAQTRVPVVRELSLTGGARRDSYSDVAAITRTQYGLVWEPYQAIKVHASAGTSFLPPSLYALHFPRVATPISIPDPRRSNQVTPIVVITGGNPNLKPTTGGSRNFGMVLGSEKGWRVSIDRWKLQLSNRIALLPFYALLTHEGMTDRVTRGEASEADRVLGHPGPLTAVDISRVNFGELMTSGLDIGLQGRLNGRTGKWTPRLDVTVTDRFRSRELPGAPLTDRVAIASEQGTIAKTRVVASMTYEGSKWGANIFARYHSSYQDWNPTLGLLMDRRIPSNTIWDFNISRTLGNHARVAVGVMDVLNREPAYAEVTAAGFDTSLDDLKGRSAYFSLSGSF